MYSAANMNHTVKAWEYEIASLDVCLVVLMTRMELEHVSDTALATNPIHAALRSFLGRSS